MAQKRRRKSNRRRRRRDTAGIVLRLIVILLILFIAGLILWFIWHDRDLRSGVNALKKERYEDAIACFDSSIAKGKDEAEAYRGKGVALYELEKYEEAANALESSLDKGSDPDAQICNLLALSYIGQEKYQESIAWLEKGIADESGSRELKQEMRYQLVFAYEKTSQWDKAKECAQQYLADFPDDQKMTREYQFLQTR